jgi:hypothetical protein
MTEPGEPITWEEIWQRSEEARVPTIMAFGKHKETAIKGYSARLQAVAAAASPHDLLSPNIFSCVRLRPSLLFGHSP